LPRAGTRACATPAAVQSGERAEAAEAEISSLLELARASSASALRVPMSPSFTSPISLPSRFSVLRAERVRDARVSADIVTALVATGISSLTPVQREVLPLALAGKDVLAKAKTGTGKTMAFLIPSVARLLRNEAPPAPVDPIRVLILSGTRELASQIEAQAARLVANVPGLKLDCVLGGTSAVSQRERLDPDYVGQSKSGNKRYEGRVDVMVATPGRLLEHLTGTNGFAARLATVETLVLDEVDQLLDGGFQRDIERIISALRPSSDDAGGRQTLAFSATVPERVKATLGIALRANYETVDTAAGFQKVSEGGEEGGAGGTDANDSHARITQSYSVHSVEDSLAAFGVCVAREMAAKPNDFKMLVFLPTARQTQFVASVLRAVEGSPRVLEIHSRVSQKLRDSAADDFRNSKQVVMLSSDVSARGVDYPDISMVVQLGAPSSREVYVQRLGRTGRNGASGAGMLLLSDYEKGFVTSELAGLPIANVPWVLEGDKQSAVADPSLLLAAAAGVDDKTAAETYRAWLMANAAIRKKNRWSKEDFVAQANAFAAGVLGRSTPPAIGQDTATLLGLAGVEGLRVIEAETQDEPLCEVAEALGEESVECQVEFAVQVNTQLMGAAMKAAGKAKHISELARHINELGQEGLVALKSELETHSSAEVLGFRVDAKWVTIERPVPKQTATKSPKTPAPLPPPPPAVAASFLAATGPPPPTAEEKKQATARVAAAGKALAAALAEHRGDKSQPTVANAIQELEGAKADLMVTSLKMGLAGTRK